MLVLQTPFSSPLVSETPTNKAELGFFYAAVSNTVLAPSFAPSSLQRPPALSSINRALISR